MKRSGRRWMRTAAASLLLGAAAAGACGGPKADAPPPEPAPEPDRSAGAEARLPIGGTDFAPALVRLADGEHEADVDLLSDVDTCISCHNDVVDHWEASAHGNSSFDNPWYRAAVDVFREEVGFEESRFCAGCHDPLLLVAGKMDEEIQPDDRLAHAGVTCLVCHSVTDVSVDGNGSYTLTSAPVEIPELDDEASIERHRQRLTPEPLRTAKLCGSCHRGFLGPDMGNPHFLPGMDDLGPWRASAHSGSHATRLDDTLEEQTCQGCHMSEFRAQNGRSAGSMLANHRFAGGQTALAEQRGQSQLDAVVEQLRGAATVDVAALRAGSRPPALPADGAELSAGDAVTFDVVIRNHGAAHAFPGGVRDTQDTWVEVVIRDAAGRIVAEAGTEHERSLDDPTAHRLITVLLDGEARPQLEHLVQRFHAPAYDHTVAARDARVVRYAVELPHDLSAFPLRIEARLRHRRHVAPMHRLACEATETERGQAFLAASRRFGETPLTGCEPQPVTELADAMVYVGPGANRPGTGGAARPTWRRLYEHAIGLSHDVQERLDDARPSLERALALATELDDVEGTQARAMILSVLGGIEGRQGRLEDALATVDLAEALVGEHPALARIRGDAYAQVWRWPEAAAAYGRVVDLAPFDTRAHRDLARARGSAGDDLGALSAATVGLGFFPRDESMLRTQALAVAAMSLPVAADAREAFLAHRKPDHASNLRLRCAREVELCDRDRQPVPRIVLRVP